LWLSSAITVVIVILDVPSKLAAPVTSPPRAIVRAVVSASAVAAIPLIEALIVPFTVRLPVTVLFPDTLSVPTLAVSTAAMSMLAVPSI
jgi:hypothetical protein